MADISLFQALSRRRTVRTFTAAPIARGQLERLLWAAQGITGEDGRRTAPSAHALHPLRLFVAAGRVDGLETGLYEIDAEKSEIRGVRGGDLRQPLRKAAIGEPDWIENAACIIVVCADMLTPARAFADQAPHGARGARYAYLEAGAATQNCQLQCVAEGLGCVLVGGFDDEATARVLGLEAPVAPIAELCIGYPHEDD